MSEFVYLIPYLISGLSLFIALLALFYQQRGNKLLTEQLDQQAEQIRLQGEQLKKEGRASFIEEYYPPLIKNLKEALINVKKKYEFGQVGPFDELFGELLKRDVEGTLGMIKPLSDKIYNGLKKVVDHYIPALNTIRRNQRDSISKIREQWILFMMKPESMSWITIIPHDFVRQLNFIWSLWRCDYKEAKKEFDTRSASSLNPEYNSELLGEKIFNELSDIANVEWTPIRQGFKTLHDEMRKWIYNQAILPMEMSLAEITEELRTSSTASS